MYHPALWQLCCNLLNWLPLMGIWVASSSGLLQKMLQWTVLYSHGLSRRLGHRKPGWVKAFSCEHYWSQVLTNFVFFGGGRVLACQVVSAPLRIPRPSGPASEWLILSGRVVRRSWLASPSSHGLGAPSAWRSMGTHGYTSSMGPTSTSSRCLTTRSVRDARVNYLSS